MKLKLFIFPCCLVSIICRAQQEKNKIFKKVFEISIEKFLGQNPVYVISSDSTANKGIQSINFADFIESSIGLRHQNVDTSLNPFLRYADKKKSELRKIRIPSFSSRHTVRVVSGDSLNMALKHKNLPDSLFEKVFQGAGSWISVSSIILSRNKSCALIEISQYFDARNGHSDIMLLKKIKRKWVVAKVIRYWVS